MTVSIYDFDWISISSLLIDKINELIKELDTNYRSISEILNVDQAGIHKVLNKQRGLSFETYIRICLALAEINRVKNKLPDEACMPSTLMKEIGI